MTRHSWPASSYVTRLSGRFTLRGIMLLGMALVCLVWVGTGYRAALEHSQTEELARRSLQSLDEATTLLSTVRVQVLVASVTVRDVILEPDPALRPQYLAQLAQARRIAMLAFEQHDRAGASADEQAAFDQLKAELDAFWVALESAVALPAGTDRATGSSRSESFRPLRATVVERRQAVLTLVDHIQALHQRSVAQHDAERAAAYDTERRRLWWWTALALLSSIVIALVGTSYLGRLERALDQRLLEDARQANDLHRLSRQVLSIQDEERRMIARELHDEIGQALTAIKLELGVALRQAAAGANPQDHLEAARDITDRTLEEVRDLSRLFHPDLLDHFGLATSLERYVDGFVARTAIQARLVAPLTGQRYAPDVETCVYRLVVEALTNVARHAAASACTITLSQKDDALSVVIEDDGQGFDPKDTATTTRGLGLLSIEERVRLLHGTFRIESRPSHGTRIHVTLPASVAPAIDRHEVETGASPDDPADTDDSRRP